MSLNPRYKLVLRPEFPTIDGVRSLNGLPEQPYVDSSGHIDMSGNYLLVKHIEAGTQEFTTEDEKGIINVFSDSTAKGVSCINFMHDRNNIGGMNRQYCSFYPDNNNNKKIAGSITGNSSQVAFNTTSDGRLKNIVNNTGLYSISNGTTFNNWLDSVNTLTPIVYQFNSSSDSNGYKFYNTMDDKNNNIYTITDYQGFIASDVQTVYPPSVHGVSGETIKKDGKEQNVYQQLDMTKLIPMMVGSIQELSTKVSNLEAFMNGIGGNDGNGGNGGNGGNDGNGGNGGNGGNDVIKSGVKYTSYNGLFCYTINNTNSTYDSNDYYQPIKDAIDKWDRLLRIPTIYTTNSGYTYTVLDIDINFVNDLKPDELSSAIITNVTSPGDDYIYGNTFATSGLFDLNISQLTSMKNHTYNNGLSQLYYTALHEIGHILGIGPMWSSQYFIKSIPRKTYEENGQTKYYYTGENALTEYKSYFSTNISVNWIGIPLEDDGGQGIQNIHPEEGIVDNGGISLATRTINGVIYYGLNDELMTGWSETAVEMPLSRVTLGFLKDIGYNVNYALADEYTTTY